MKNIYQGVQVTVELLQIADNELLTGATIDMKGYEDIAFIAACGAIEAGDVYTMKVQSGAQSTMGDAADLLGSGLGFTMSTSTFGEAIVDIHNPQERYVRACLEVPNLTSTVAPVTVIAIQYNPRVIPVTNVNAEGHNAPAEGTA